MANFAKQNAFQNYFLSLKDNPEPATKHPAYDLYLV